MAKFCFSGDYVTNMARRTFFEDRLSYKEAEKCLLPFLGGQPEEVQKTVARQILEGRKKLVGTNEYELVDDDRYRPITDEDILNREREIILSIKKDMESHAEKYIDFYALDKSWRFFMGNTPKQVWEYAYTPMNVIADRVRCSDVAMVNLQPVLSELLDLSHCPKENERVVLDHGAYLVYDYLLVYQLLGEPLSTGNRTYFYEQLYKYWKESPLRTDPVIKRRQKAYENSQKSFVIIRPPMVQKEADKKAQELRKAVDPTPDGTFTSRLGIIDPDGRWYSVEWAEHSLKAKAVLTAKGIALKTASLDAYLDKAVALGFVFIRDVERTGKPYVEGRPNAVQKQTIESYCNYFGIDSLD